MRRPPYSLPPATNRTPPKSRATPSACSHIQRTVAWSVRYSRDGRGRDHGTACPARQPAKYRLRNQEKTA